MSVYLRAMSPGGALYELHYSNDLYMRVLELAEDYDWNPTGTSTPMFDGVPDLD